MSSARPVPGGPGTLAKHTVARIGYGAMQLAQLGDRPAPDEQQAVSVLRRAVELGVNHIDTADFYGDGTSNTRIREALSPYSDELVLVSKVGANHVAGAGLVPAQKPAELRASVESNLRRLDVERLAVVNLRRLEDNVGLRADGDQVVPLDDQLAELSSLRDEGKIGGIGLSGVTLERLEQALPVGIACVQNEYSLVERRDEPILDLCREHGVAWVPFFPLGSAFPGRPKVVDQPVVQQIAQRLDVSPSQIGLAWLLAHYADTLLIPGTASVEHLEQNLASGDVRLSADEQAALDAVNI